MGKIWIISIISYNRDGLTKSNTIKLIVITDKNVEITDKVLYGNFIKANNR